MKNKLTLIALLALFLTGTYNVYAQDDDALEITPTKTESSVKDAKTEDTKEEKRKKRKKRKERKERKTKDAKAADAKAADAKAADAKAADAKAADAKAADTKAADTKAADTKAELEAEESSFHQIIKQKFIEGGPGFMGIVLLCLILGLALAIERIIYLNMATTNTAKLLNDVESSLKEGGVDAAKEVCRNTKGPVASIFYQGLDRSGEGIDMVEKSIVSYGSVQMGLLEKGLSWISLFIALAPMLGFMGTVIGMIGAFDAIEVAGDISPSLVAGGIKVALLTTVFGLIVAMILQVFYNYLIAKVDSLVNSMEDASISLIDLLVKNK